MKSVTYTQARANLAQLLDNVVKDGEEVLVRRGNRSSVVLVPVAAWNAIQETMHLLSTPANAKALRRSIDELDALKNG